jgi:SAM-dependent methyltransferase
MNYLLRLIKKVRVVAAVWVSLIFFLLGQAMFVISKILIMFNVYDLKYSRGLKEEIYIASQNFKLLLAPSIRSAYFGGFPYQSLEYPQLFGDRATLRRLEEYGLLGSISTEHSVLDLGCAEGFLGIKISQLTGANVLNVEHSQVAVNRGMNLISFLKLTNVKYALLDLRSFESQNKFDRILAMAAYKTDDGGVEMNLNDYLKFLMNLLAVNGLIYFESHFESKDFEISFINVSKNVGLSIEDLRWVDSGNRLYAVLKQS